MILRRIDPVSLAKILGLVYAILGLLFGGIFTLIALAGVAAKNEGEEKFGFLFGAAAVILFPIFYGAMGALSGAIGALIYNVVAKWIGGVELELSPNNGTASGSPPIA